MPPDDVSPAPDPIAEDEPAQPPRPALPAPSPIPGAYAIAAPVPFGLGQDKPHELLDLARAAWAVRDEASYAWRVLRHAACDGCALGSRGLRDDAHDGLHLCAKRVAGLARLTRPALAPVDLIDIERLRRMDDDGLAALGRIPYPFVYRPGARGFSRVSWDEALGLIALRLRDMPGERMAFTAAPDGHAVEALYALQKAARLLGSNHVGLTGAAGPTALRDALGDDGATASLRDLVGADLVLVLGDRIGVEQPMIMPLLVRAKRAGTRVITLHAGHGDGIDRWWALTDPRSALFGTAIADDAIRVAPGGEGAFLSGVLKSVAIRGGEDRGWIDAHTTGWDDHRTALDGLSWAALESASGAERRQMEWVAEVVVRARSAVTLCGPEVTADGLGAAVTLHLARGTIGRDRCGILPLPKIAGELGARDVGLVPDGLPGPRPLTAAAELGALWGHDVPTWPGTSDLLQSAFEGNFDLLYTMGGDPRGAHVTADYATLALQRTKLRIHQDTAMNAAMLVDPLELLVLLPAATLTEQRGGGVITTIERRLRYTPEIPGGPEIREARPAWAIPGQVAATARRHLGGALLVTDAAELRAEIGRSVPRYAGIEELSQEDDNLQWGGPQRYADGRFPTGPDGRARFAALPRTGRA